MSFGTGGDEFPFPEKLALLQKGETVVPAKDPWHYKERIDDQAVFGLQPPLWVVVFCDNLPAGEPGEGEPKRAFTIEDGEVIPRGGHGPTDDEYVVVKDFGGGQVALVMAAERSGYANGIQFDGEAVIPNTDEVDPGYMVNLGLE